MAKKKENELKVVNVRLVKEPSLYNTEPVKTPQDVLNLDNSIAFKTALIPVMIYCSI